MATVKDGSSRIVVVPSEIPASVTARLNWRGDWAVAAKYKVNDAVYYAGESFVAILDHTAVRGTEPGTGIESRRVWSILARKTEQALTAAQQAQIDSKAPLGHQHTSNDIEDMTDAGRALAIAEDDAEQRAALKVYSHFTRAGFVAAVAAGFIGLAGTSIEVAGLSYLWKAGATSISDLPGLVPAGTVTVEHFGADKTGASDPTTKVQAAINYALATGEKAVRFPAGTFTFPATTALDPGVGNLAFIGAGMDQTIFVYDEGTSGSPRNLFRNTTNTAKGALRFEGIQFKGTLDTNGRRAGSPLYLDWYSAVDLVNCKFLNIAGMSTDFHSLGRFSCTGCHFESIAADACRVRDTSNIRIDGNYFKRIGDDVIAIHSARYEVIADIAAPRPIPSRHIITNNTMVNASRRGIVSLGGRVRIITGNVMQLVGLSGIAVGTMETLASSGLEGATAQHDTLIAHNEILDMQYIPAGVVGSPGSYISINPPVPRGAAATNSTKPLRYNSTTSSIVKPWDWYQVDTADTAYPIPPFEGLVIVDNICRRTLQNVAKYSDYGHGTFIDQGVSYDPAIAEGNLRCGGGIKFEEVDGAKNLNISRNIIEHTGAGLYIGSASADELGLSGLIEVNQIKDATGYGILLYPNAAKNSNLRIRGNRFDCDTFRMAANSNMNGSYLANSTPVGVSLGLAEGCVVTENEFLNCCTALSGDTTKNLIDRNLVWLSTPAALGFNTGNKGIGNVPAASLGFDYMITDCDPTSANYMEVGVTLPRRASAMPSSGWFPAGWIVFSSTGSTLGWMRLTTGSNHTLGTDWAAIPTLNNAQTVTGSWVFKANPVIGDGSTNAVGYLNGASGTARMTQYQTGGVNRWRVGAQETAESGSNVGSDFVIAPFNDAGTLQSSAVFIERAAGRVRLKDMMASATYTVATLPSGALVSQMAYATDGRKNGEGAGLGTGVWCFKDASGWKAFDTGAAVSA